MLRDRLAGLAHARQADPAAPLAGSVAAPARAVVTAGRSFRLPVVVRNDGPETWCADGAIFAGRDLGPGLGLVGDIHVGIRRWRGAGGGAEQVAIGPHGRPLDARGDLPYDVAPGETAAVVIADLAPRRRGIYRAEIDLVAEHVRWFRPADSPPAAVVEIEVRGPVPF